MLGKKNCLMTISVTSGGKRFLKAGLTDLKFHDLRKTFGSLLAQNGVSTAVTQKLLEHS